MIFILSIQTILLDIFFSYRLQVSDCKFHYSPILLTGSS